MSEFTVHPTAIVDDGAEIGAGSRVWHWTHICGGARIGERCSFGQNVFVGNDVIVGNNVKVQNNVSIYDAVTLEDDVFCGPSMVFTNVNNPRSHVSRKHEYRRTVIRHGATIGANATIVCGHEVGAFAFIGAGSVVTRDVAAYALMVGTPAHRIGWMCQCGERLPSDIGEHACPGCGQHYKISGERCTPLSE
jgi:UDP-2-acetamido-3-amino-2,3-dideoxy-glucuronate N-acetyltransferase